MTLRFTLTMLLAIIFCWHSSAQVDPVRVSGNYDTVPAVRFLADIERQTGYQFFYDSARLDTVNIITTLNSELLPDALAKAFANTGIFFAIDKQKNVFITSGRALRIELPEGFAAGNTNSPRDSSENTGRQAVVRNADRNAVKASQDNKLYVIGNPSSRAAGRVSVAGYIRDARTAEPISGASIQIEKLNIATITDQYGYYSLEIPSGRHVFNVQSVGMDDTRRQVMVYAAGKLDIDLRGRVTTLKNVIISARKVSNVRGTQMGVQKIDIKTIKQVPVVFGEADVLRVIMATPGVKTVGEASTGLNVRGGSADQNLILFNDATIFNPAHFFGMFSAFNPEIVKDVTLYKSSIPARFGGRLSSVLDIASREGNKKNIAGSAGIGLLTSRLNVEGPLVKNKSSFNIGGRATYANWLLNLLPDQYKNSRAGFHDVNVNLSHEINKKNSLYLTAYLSNDRFNLNSDTVYGYGNRNLSLKWKHVFNNKFNALFSTGVDQYRYKISSDADSLNAYRLGFDIDQVYFKGHFTYYLNKNHTLEFGVNSVRYQLDPGTYTPFNKESLVVADTVRKEQALESAVYLSDKYNLSNSISIEAGLRYSVFSFLGPNTVNNYFDGKPLSEGNMTGTSAFGKGQFIKTYGGPEYRLSGRLAFNQNFSFKAGFNTLRQYIHVLSNTSAMAPTDIWKLSDPNIKPQSGSQISAGLYHNFKANTIETSVEVYYRKIRDYLDYKSGASLVMNHHIETDVIGTRAKAYGVEVLLKKLTGKLNGWVSYSWSRILLRQNDTAVGEIINGGQYYPANYDKPHDVTVIGNFRVNHRFSVSLNATYSTGRPITMPVGRYFYSGSFRTLFADRNTHRIPDYFRTDLSMNIDGNHKVNQKTHNSWTIGVYNLTGRKNPYSIYYVSEGGAINGYKLSIFGSAIPFVNFNIRF